MARCPEPFLLASNFPPKGGDVVGRFCAKLPTGLGNTTINCCLPCPTENWFYSDRIASLFVGAEVVAIVGVVCSGLLLLSYAVLPVEYTHRHYLSVSLVAACFLMTFALVIPLLAQGPQCYDTITPHNMYSSMSCAFSGALIIGGGWAAVTWGFIRTLSVHLQICWKVTPGRMFLWGSQLFGWGLSIVFLALPLSLTGVSYRFGGACHLRSENSLQTFWGPLLGVASSSIVLQAITVGYCIKVYIQSLLVEGGTETTTTDGATVTNASSMRTLTPRQAFRRIKRVIAMQWRGIAVVLLMLTDVIFLGIIFVSFNTLTEKTPENVKKAAPWIQCLIQSGGDKNKCLDKAHDLVIPENTAMAMLYLLSLNGIWAMLLLGRPQIITGWYRLFKPIFCKKVEGDEFVSYNAAHPDGGLSTYEMLGSTNGKLGGDYLKSKNAEGGLKSAFDIGPQKNDKGYESSLYESKPYRSQYPLKTRFSAGSLHSSSVESAPRETVTAPLRIEQRGYPNYSPPQPTYPSPTTPQDLDDERYVSVYGSSNYGTTAPNGEDVPIHGLRHPPPVRRNF